MCEVGLGIPNKPNEVFILITFVYSQSCGSKLNGSMQSFACWGDDTCPEYSAGHYPPVVSVFLPSLRAVWDLLRLESGPKLYSADVTGQISVTPPNIFKLLPSGCRRHWEVLDMIALTVSDANHSWKGDSTFGCYLLGERKKIPTSLTLGHFDL